jgi:pyruvate formate lyase activating enzyme
MAERALVFDVQRFSIHDGPGIRTVVFFKGCSLACEWCQNPEAMSAAPEIAYYAERCLAECHACEGVCRERAILPDPTARVDFARCTACGDCVEVCPTRALRIVGREVSSGELLREVLRDRPFYAASGGGITLSGGEPVLQAAFLERFLPRARAEGLHVALETAGAYPFERLEPLLPGLDLVLFDLKVADPERHRRYTTRDNALILENLRRLLEAAVAVEVRMPVVPERNADDRNVRETAELLASLGVGRLTLLPYNHLWEAKLPRLGTAREPLRIAAPQAAFYEDLARRFAERGLVAGL